MFNKFHPIFQVLSFLFPHPIFILVILLMYYFLSTVRNREDKALEEFSSLLIKNTTSKVIDPYDILTNISTEHSSYSTKHSQHYKVLAKYTCCLLVQSDLECSLSSIKYKYICKISQLSHLILVDDNMLTNLSTFISNSSITGSYKISLHMRCTNASKEDIFGVITTLLHNNPVDLTNYGTLIDIQILKKYMCIGITSH